MTPNNRQRALLFIFGIVFLIFAARLFYLQILSADYARQARSNAIKRRVQQPSRGVIYDRKGRIYVTNTPSFELKIIPRELVIPDTSILERYLELDRETIRERIRDAREHSMVKPSTLARYISYENFYTLQEHLWKFKGVYFEKSFTRDYLSQVGANFLGYISEVNDRDIEKSAGYYDPGDLIGATGLEREYEELLRGRKGVRMVLTDVFNREVGSFADGKYDTLPEKGKDVVISIDMDLQKFGEELMAHKKGSIVAIEPKTGEILSFVSAPSYDPGLLSGTELKKNWRNLAMDTLKPLFNRSLMAQYPPGSVFKVLNALIALNEGTITPGTYYGCAGGFSRNKGRPACHAHPSPLSPEGAIQHSCNAYFAATYVDFLHNRLYEDIYESYSTWREYMEYFGVGVKTGVDLPSEKKGLIPTTDFYDKWYGHNRWKGMTIVSNSIGQGEVTMTPLQMANVVCAIANKGYYVEPHFFKEVFNDSTGETTEQVRERFAQKGIPIDAAWFTLATDAMEKVVSAGTGYMARLKDIAVCGKTGTAQNPHGKDHSVFFAFAPKEDPQIAVAVIVENATWGGVWAAPIASLMIEKYLKGEIEEKARLERILEKKFIVPPRPARRAPTPAAPAQTATAE